MPLLLTENTFQSLSDDIIIPAEELTLSILEKINEIAEELIDNPEATINSEAVRGEVEALWQTYNKRAIGWTDTALATAYLKAIKVTDSEIPPTLNADFGIPPTIELRIAGRIAGGGGDISATAASILDDFPAHHNIYTAFQDSAYNQFAQTRLPVVRDTQGKIRDLIIQASEAEYKTADGFTRRKLSQQLMNRFADENITGIRYSDGRTMNLDSYSEMVARSQTGNAARQASINRQQEYGLDLVQISQHFPTSDLCAPHQGKAYSLSGTDSNYPPFENTNPGAELYHSYCKHFQSPYIPGTSKLPDESMTRRQNRQQFEATQTQRYNERQIRAWKRREASALTDDARDKARSKVRQWQKRNRELVDNNSFLRRKYARESI